MAKANTPSPAAVKKNTSVATTEKPAQASQKPVVTPTPATEAHSGHLVIHATPVRCELISGRAYELFEKRGCVHGFHQEDWAEAERQLIEEGLN